MTVRTLPRLLTFVGLMVFATAAFSHAPESPGAGDAQPPSDGGIDTGSDASATLCTNNFIDACAAQGSSGCCGVGGGGGGAGAGGQTGPSGSNYFPCWSACNGNLCTSGALEGGAGGQCGAGGSGGQGGGGIGGPTYLYAEVNGGKVNASAATISASQNGSPGSGGPPNGTTGVGAQKYP